MRFDLHRAMFRKQERECARLDAFRFRHRAKTIRRIAEWVRARQSDSTRMEPMHYVRMIALEPDEAILAAIRAEDGSDISDREWVDVCSQISAQAWQQLVDELGDPSPQRMA